MSSSVVFEEQVEIPMDVRTLVQFRRWAVSDGFPDRGRIDFVGGRIEVDMSPEDIFCHGTLKGEIYGALYQRVKRGDLGLLLTDRTRVSSDDADLSVEPDIVFIAKETLDGERARLVPKATGEPGRYIEVAGSVDLIVEIVSDSSVIKDTQRLPERYAKAGVREFWLADARSEPIVFRIHCLTETGYEAVEPDADGFQRSAVFNCGFQLCAARDGLGHWRFDLVDR